MPSKASESASSPSRPSSSRRRRTASRTYLRCWWSLMIPHSRRDRPRVEGSSCDSRRHRVASSSSSSTSSERVSASCWKFSFIEYSSPSMTTLPIENQLPRPIVRETGIRTSLNGVTTLVTSWWFCPKPPKLPFKDLHEELIVQRLGAVDATLT